MAICPSRWLAGFDRTGAAVTCLLMVLRKYVEEKYAHLKSRIASLDGSSDAAGDAQKHWFCPVVGMAWNRSC